MEMFQQENSFYIYIRHLYNPQQIVFLALDLYTFACCIILHKLNENFFRPSGLLSLGRWIEIMR